jgi:hypothetical protein
VNVGGQNFNSFIAYGGRAILMIGPPGAGAVSKPMSPKHCPITGLSIWLVSLLRCIGRLFHATRLRPRRGADRTEPYQYDQLERFHRGVSDPMPRRYWLPILATIGLILAGQVHAQAVSHNAGSHTNAAKGQQKPEADTPPAFPVAVQNDIHGIASALETANNHPYAQEDRQRAKDALEAQQDTVFWACLMFCVALLETCVTGAGVFLVWKTLAASRDAAGHAKRAAYAARDTVNSMEDTAKRQLRAYVNIEEGGIGGGTANITVKNFGQTPANFLTFWADAVVTDRGNPPFARPDGAENSPEISVPPQGSFEMHPKIRDSRSRNPADWTFYAFGEFNYTDIFGKRQSAQFYLRAPSTGGAMHHFGPHNTVT